MCVSMREYMIVFVCICAYVCVEFYVNYNICNMYTDSLELLHLVWLFLNINIYPSFSRCGFLACITINAKRWLSICGFQ